MVDHSWNYNNQMCCRCLNLLAYQERRIAEEVYWGEQVLGLRWWWSGETSWFEFYLWRSRWWCLLESLPLPTQTHTPQCILCRNSLGHTCPDNKEVKKKTKTNVNQLKVQYTRFASTFWLTSASTFWNPLLFTSPPPWSLQTPPTLKKRGLLLKT